MRTRVHPPMAARGLAIVAFATGLALLTACTTSEAPVVSPVTRIQPLTPTPSMTTVGATGLETSPASDAPEGAPDDAGLTAPAPSPKEVARVVISQNHTESESGLDAAASGAPVRLLAKVRCLGVGGPTSATLLVTTGTYSVLGAPDQAQVLARRQVSCDGKPLRLDLGATLKGAAGVVLVEPANEGLRGYAILLRS
ncbi:MAG: hypothetical protein ABI112_05540 [Terracoccus sp.]